MTSESLNKSLGTKYHSQTTTTVLEAESNSANKQPCEQLIHTTESALAGQGLDVAAPPGVDNARFVQTLLTPSGPQPVILLTDRMIDLDVKHDFIPGCPLPEQGHVWSTKQDSVAAGANVSLSTAVKFSTRTTYYMSTFQYYNCHTIVRLICKPALTQSQSFWVSRSANQLDFSTKRSHSEIGFNWVPSKQNEIYVLLPWFNENYIVPASSSPADVFGYLNVRNLTELVSTTGNEAPLQIAYYFSPLNMYTYNPIPVQPPLVPLAGAVTFQSYPYQFPSGSTNVASLKVTSPTYISLRGIQGQTYGGAQQIYTVLVNNLHVGQTTYATVTFALSSTPVLFQAGLYTINFHSGFGTFSLGSSAELNWFGLVAPTIQPLAKEQLGPSPHQPLAKAQLGPSPHVKEIPRVVSKNYINTRILPGEVVINHNISHIISNG